MCAYQQSVRIKRVLLLSVKKHLLLQQNTKEIKEDYAISQCDISRSNAP